MKRTDKIPGKIFTLQELKQRAIAWRLTSKTIAFTNGVFDILHAGHIEALSGAAMEADKLIVAINSDASVKRLKGNKRPVNNQAARALILASLVIVDAVVVFDEDTPLEVIKELLPDVLIKGGDYTEDSIVGSKEVRDHGGRVVIVPLKDGFSTTGIIEKIQNQQ